MQINIKNGDKWETKDCVDIGCNNISQCGDGCIGFEPKGLIEWDYALDNDAEDPNNWPDEDYGDDLQHYKRETFQDIR